MRLLALLLVAAMAVGALAGQPDLFRVIKEQNLPDGEHVSPVDKLGMLLRELENTVSTEQNTTQAHFLATMADYNRTIQIYNFTHEAAARNRSLLDAKMNNLTDSMNAIERDLATLDERIAVKGKIISQLQALIDKGSRVRLDGMVDFQRRRRVHQLTIQAVDHMMDYLGDADELANSLKKTLNERVEPKAAPAAASLVEVGAEVEAPFFSPALEELGELLGMYHEEMNAYVKEITLLELERKAMWDGLVFKYNASINNLTAEIKQLEDSREPNEKKVSSMRDEYVSLEKVRADVNAQVESVAERLKNKLVARDALIQQNNKLTEERNLQLHTVDRMQSQLEQHDGNVPKINPAAPPTDEERATL